MNPKLGRQDLILLPQATLRQIDNAADPDFGSGFICPLLACSTIRILVMLIEQVLPEALCE